MSGNTVKKILWVAGAFNIAGVLIFSLFFTNPYLSKHYPAVFSDFGLLSIMLWGMAYIAAAGIFTHARWIMFVFAVEKLVYVITWIAFMATKGSSLPGIFNESILTGLFFSAYGPGDLAFGCFFAWVGVKGSSISA